MMRHTIKYHGYRKCFMAAVVRKQELYPLFSPDGTKVWADDQKRTHRDGAPAVIKPDGTEIWVQHGKKHRGDGPAVTYPTAPEKNEWWLDGSPWPEGKRAAEDAVSEGYAQDATVLQGQLRVGQPLKLRPASKFEFRGHNT
jgi:hypothetical protein